MRPPALALVLALSGCATARQCSVGVVFLGPVPLPTASCDLIFSPAEDEEED